MTIPFITWACIAGLFAAALIVRLVRAVIFCSEGRHRIVEFGSEREEFFIPGDPVPGFKSDCDYDDFEDL